MAREVEDFLAGELGISDYRCYWSAGRMFRVANWRRIRTNIYGTGGVHGVCLCEYTYGAYVRVHVWATHKYMQTNTNV